MPIYEYSCTACGHQFDAMQRISDEPLLICPACDKPALTKLVSAAGFRLKGGGWYETDFKQGEKKNIAHGESEKKTAETTSKTESSGSSDTSSTKSETSSAKEVKKTSETSSSAATKTSSEKAKE